MAELQDISMDDVGSAEDTLRKLIHERRTLENAADVLRTYRMVQAQLKDTVKELGVVQALLTQEKAALQQINTDKSTMLEQVQSEITQFKSDETNKLTSELDVIRKQRANEQSKLDSIVAQSKATQVTLNNEIATYNQQITAAQVKLETLKKEHGVLAESIGKAAQFFTER